MKGHAAYATVQSGGIEQQLEEHMPLVKRLAHHLSARLPSSVQIDDLLQAGMIGLLEALNKYDATQGAQFSTYASIRIRGAMLDELRRGDWAPRSVHRKGREVMETINRLEQQGLGTSDQEIADAMGISMEEYSKVVQDSNMTCFYSIDLLEEETPGGSNIEDERDGPLEMLSDVGFRDALAREIGNLPEREKMMMALYYQEDLNLREIGEVMGVSESRVSQIHGQAMLRLRARMKDWVE
jgi:RNA polymerase sigma factor for flagellar operon FliA